MLIRLIVCLLLLADAAHAQDVNYWSSSYGPGGFLAPGATIANNGDSGVFFYNPALFGYSRKSSASISGTIYQYQYTKIKDGTGTGLDLKSTGGSVIPQIASNTITLKTKKGAFTIAYALLHEPIMSFTGTQRKDARLNVLSDTYSPGDETFVGQYTAQNNIDETAGILSTGFMLSPRLAVGFSAEGRLRKQSYSVNLSSRALYNTTADTIFPPIASAEEYYLNSYTHIGLRFRAGLAYDVSTRDHLGLLITTPMLHITGSSTMVADQEISDIRQGSLTWNLLATTRQTGLKAKYKMPVSLALGYTHDFETSQVFFSAEYFAKVKEYNIVTPRKDAFIRPDTANNAGTPDLTRLRDSHKAILNVAIGFSKTLSPTVTGIISFRTDFNYGGPSSYKNYETSLGYPSNTADWNLYHMQLGANFRKRKFNLRAGLLLDYGHTTQYLQTVNYDNPNEDNFLLGEIHRTKATRLGAGLMFAYIHNL